MELSSSVGYEALAIELVKRDVLLESVRDMCFLFTLSGAVAELGAKEPEASRFAARAVSELIEDGYVELLDEKGENVSSKNVSNDIDTLTQLVRDQANGVSTLSLSPTELARKWVGKYWAVINEIHNTGV